MPGRGTAAPQLLVTASVVAVVVAVVVVIGIGIVPVGGGIGSGGWVSEYLGPRGQLPPFGARETTAAAVALCPPADGVHVANTHEERAAGPAGAGGPREARHAAALRPLLAVGGQVAGEEAADNKRKQRGVDCRKGGRHVVQQRIHGLRARLVVVAARPAASARQRGRTTLRRVSKANARAVAVRSRLQAGEAAGADTARVDARSPEAPARAVHDVSEKRVLTAFPAR